jgi:hypothetical protein
MLIYACRSPIWPISRHVSMKAWTRFMRRKKLGLKWIGRVSISFLQVWLFLKYTHKELILERSTDLVLGPFQGRVRQTFMITVTDKPFKCHSIFYSFNYWNVPKASMHTYIWFPKILFTLPLFNLFRRCLLRTTRQNKQPFYTFLTSM